MRFQTLINNQDTEVLKDTLLQQFKSSEAMLLLDSNQVKGEFDWMLAVGKVDDISCGYENAFDRLEKFHNKHNDWIFGALSYDLKNDTEQLSSQNNDGIDAPELYFFVPEYRFVCLNGNVEVYRHDCVAPWQENDNRESYLNDIPNFDGHIKPRVSKKDYLNTVRNIQKYIQYGDIYEMNYCQEFYSTEAQLNPLDTFKYLNRISKAPFSCFYKQDNLYLISASPERYIKKIGTRLISQPIKGTRKRGYSREEDARLKKELLDDPKERSENVMIVDLVRNDFSRIAKSNSVTVDELFGIYTFDQVHQMISTISCEIDVKTTLSTVLKATFPMGSMTGAPKIRAMELIENFESTKRGLYSGAVGYISPEGNFDFNVVIRSILYNSAKQYLSFMVGSAITIASIAEHEYEECFVKAKALFEALGTDAAEV